MDVQTGRQEENAVRKSEEKITDISVGMSALLKS